MRARLIAAFATSPTSSPGINARFDVTAFRVTPWCRSVREPKMTTLRRGPLPTSRYVMPHDDEFYLQGFPRCSAGWKSHSTRRQLPRVWYCSVATMAAEEAAPHQAGTAGRSSSVQLLPAVSRRKSTRRCPTVACAVEPDQTGYPFVFGKQFHYSLYSLYYAQDAHPTTFWDSPEEDRLVLDKEPREEMSRRADNPP